MKIKVTREFLEIPVGIEGEIIQYMNRSGKCDKSIATSCAIKFSCKEEPVLIQYPGDAMYGDYYVCAD